MLNTVELNSQNYKRETNWSGKFLLILSETNMQLAKNKELVDTLKTREILVRC